ncbi:MAG TPA: hypothetical protein VGX50_20045, partial [Longimicrobium sp.]|nr:hypothetical protein [Longimicrobium sp.]
RPADAASANGKASGNGTDPLWRFGLQVTAGGNGEDAPWLLRYEKDERDGQYHLRARGIDPVPGHHRVWKIVGTAEDLEALDLLENMRRYLASPVRDSHDKLLASDIHELECGEQGPVFARAYEQYAEQLEGIASWHRGHGRLEEERLHLRVAGLLRRYARGLDAHEVPVP